MKFPFENKNLVLVLNNGYSPINICTINRAYKLIVKGRAEIIEEDNHPINTSNKSYPRPSVIRLLNTVVFYKKISVTRNNIFKRDEYRCGYCLSTQNLTVDHIIPKSKGGKYSWENLITCCQKCNNKKDDKSLADSGMKLLFEPYRPNFISFIKNFNGSIKLGWNNYLY